MKTKISKKVISICLSLLICISALPLSMVAANAADYSITIKNVVYPRPGVAPQGNFTYDGSFSYELQGWTWEGDDEMAIEPESFKSFYSEALNTYGGVPYKLDKFVDTKIYSLSIMFLIKNRNIPAGTKCTVNLYDENGNSMDVSAEGYYLPVSTLKSETPEGISLPDSWTDRDTILMCSTSNMMCSPKDHIHIKGQYVYDDNRHWYECNICGQKFVNSDDEHYTYCTGTESWTCINQATASKEGEYVRKCITCPYVVERITIPKTGEQTVVTTYDELRDALAKGGKQWITLDFPTKLCDQKDFNSQYTLRVDDPEADITIDLNNCFLNRTTAYDKYLFEVIQGSLRIWQKNGNGIDSENTGSFTNNLSLYNANGKSVFYVGESGSLTLTNVYALAVGEYACSYPIVKSYGNLRIDSGIYKSTVATPAVEVRSGNVVINGGKFESVHYDGTAVGIYGKEGIKTTATINDGKFGAPSIALSIYSNTDVTINDGYFKYSNADKGVYQKKGLYAQGGDLTINGGTFYGSVCGLETYKANSLNIAGGYFNTYDENTGAAVYLNGSSNTTISRGDFTAKYGINCLQKIDFSKIIPQGCYVTDDSTGLVIDHNITDYSLGGSITIHAKKPRITTQPSGGNSAVMGDSIVLKIDADNANEYIWHIIDEDGHELSWSYLSNNGYATPQVESNGKMLFLKNVSDFMTGKRVYCVAKGYGRAVMSDIVTLSVDKVIKYCNDLYFVDLDQIWNHKTVGDFKNPINDADAPYTIGNVRWAMFRKILGDDYEFDNGDNVTVAIDVIPKEGYTFYSTVYGKLNGIDSSVTVKNEDGSRSIVFEMRITVPDEYKTQDIELSVAEPVAGKAPAETAICTSGYAVPGTPSWTPAEATFKSGEQYTVKIPVKAEYKWGDTSALTAKVNGNDAEFVIESKGKFNLYYVVYTFTAKEELPTDPTKPTDPTDPTEPTEPTKPTDPTDPTETIKPTEPTETTKPTDPTEPTDPTKPTEPTKPVVQNGTVIVDGKTVLYKDGVAVTGTEVVTVDGKTYAVVNDYVVTGKTQIVTIGSKTYIVDKNGVVIKSAKNKLIKVSSKKWYIINKYGIVIKAKKGNKLVNVGKKTYIVNKKGLVQKSTKNKLVKVGKKTYIVNKKAVVLKNKKAVKVGKKTYKVNKKGIATRKK